METSLPSLPSPHTQLSIWSSVSLMHCLFSFLLQYMYKPSLAQIFQSFLIGAGFFPTHSTRGAFPALVLLHPENGALISCAFLTPAIAGLIHFQYLCSTMPYTIHTQLQCSSQYWPHSLLKTSYNTLRPLQCSHCWTVFPSPTGSLVSLLCTIGSLQPRSPEVSTETLEKSTQEIKVY